MTTRPAPPPSALPRRTSASETARRDAADATLAVLEDELTPYLKAVRQNDKPIAAEKTMALTYVRLGMGE